MTKQSEVAKTFFIGYDPDKEQKRPHYGKAGRRNLGHFRGKMILLDMRG